MSNRIAPLRALCAAAALVLTWSGAAGAAEPLVTPDWVKSNIREPGIVFFDLRPESDYRRRHVPGAVNGPYQQAAWRPRVTSASGAISPEKAFAARVGGLGIAPGDHVVLLHAGATFAEVAAAAQVFWTFRYMGHDALSIMNGGMRAYFREPGAPVETAPNSPKPAIYVARPRPDIRATTAEVKAAIAAHETLVDYRAPGQYLGVNKENVVRRYGTLPGALNAPVSWLTIDGGGAIRTADRLRAIYDFQKIPINGPRIAFSNVALLSALGWFVTHELLGNQTSRLYVPGLVDWMTDDGNPVQRRLKFD